MLRKLFFFLILLLPIANAAEIITYKNAYYNQETISGFINLEDLENKEITTSDLGLYNKDNERENIALSLIRLDLNNYVYYFNLPNNLELGEYSISIKNFISSENNKLTYKNISTNFNLKSSNYSISVDPGIIVVDNINDQNLFELQLFNNMKKTNITIKSTDFARISNYFLEIENKSSLTIQILLNKDYDYKDMVNGHVNISYVNGEYAIPIYVRTYNTNQQKIKIEPIEKQSYINITIFKNESINGPIRFKNTGNSFTGQIGFLLTGNINDVIQLELLTYPGLQTNQTLIQNLYINNNKDAAPGNYSGLLVLKYDNRSLDFPIYITIASSEIQLISNNTESKNETIIETPVPKYKNSKPLVIGLIVAALIVLSIIVLKKKNKKPREYNKFDAIISKYLKK